MLIITATSNYSIREGACKCRIEKPIVMEATQTIGSFVSCVLQKKLIFGIEKMAQVRIYAIVCRYCTALDAKIDMLTTRS